MDNNGNNVGSSLRCVEGAADAGGGASDWQRRLLSVVANMLDFLFIIRETNRHCKRFFWNFFANCWKRAKKGSSSEGAKGKPVGWKEFDDFREKNVFNDFGGRARNERKNRDESGIIGARRVETN